MKKLFFVITGLLVSAISFGQSATDDFSGKWKAEEGAIITITKTDGRFTGLDPKGRPTLYNIRFEKNEWKGTVENHESGQKGNCEIYLEGKKLRIVAHKGIFSKTIYWVKP